MKNLLLSVLLLAGISTKSQTYLAPITWTPITIKDPQQSAGFIDVADFNNDGKKEVVLSTLIESGSASSPWSAKGAMRIFTMPGSNMSGTWTEQTVLPTSANLPFINAPQALDVDEDGILDLVVNQGFLQTNGGSHQWIKGPAFTNRYNFAPETTHGSTYYFWHEVVQFDLDGDGKKDIITTSAQTQDANNTNNGSIHPKKAKIEWYRHLGNGNFQYHLINDSLGGVFLKLHDIDHDGDQDIVVSQFFWNTSRPALVWLENTANPATTNNFQGNWNYHVIDNTTGLGYYFDFYDIDLDGKEELIYDNHNNEDNASVNYGSGTVMPGIYYFDIPSNPASSNQWPKTTIYNGFRTNLFDFGNAASQGCPGIFSIGDIDGNGYPDIAVPGDGNDTLYLFRQKPGNVFVKEIVDNGKMFGMTMITDLDGDGKKEIVAAKHNFPEAWQILFPPAGFLKIYKPTLNCTTSATSISPAAPGFCPDDSVLLTASNGLYYVWNPLNLTQSTSANTASNYSVIVTNNTGCPNTASVTVNAYSPVVPVITQNNNDLQSSTSISYQWYLNGVAISGATNAIYTPTQTGNYTVETTDNNGCTAISNTFNYVITGVEQQQNEIPFAVYPNPASELLIIELFHYSETSTIELVNMLGQSIFQKQINKSETKTSIDVSAFEQGIYFVRVSNDNGMKVQKLTIH
jgi:hypothetical protein